MITDIEDYWTRGCGRCPRFATEHCSTRLWLPGLLTLRRICLASGLTETLKWGHPCYQHQQRNVAIIGAFRDDFRLSFFDAALLTDPHGILELAGPNSPHADTWRFRDSQQPLEQERLIQQYLVEAQHLVAAGRRPVKLQHALELPAELAEVLAVDLELANAFHRLTPGRQRSYVIQLNAAKQRETRLNRIAKFREKILAGKGAQER